MIEAYVKTDGIVLVRRDFVLANSELALKNEVSLTCHPLTNGQFFAVLKALSQADWEEAIVTPEIGSVIKLSERNVVSSLHYTRPIKARPKDSSVVEKHLSPRTVENHRTKLTTEQVLEICQLVDRGKILDRSTVGYMFEMSDSEVDAVLRKIAEVYGYNYQAGRIFTNERRLAS